MPRLIDADKAKEVLTKLLYETALNNSGGASLMCEDIAENRLETWLGLVPTVDAEPVKHGEWIPKITELGTMIFRCSSCQRFSDVHWAYCPQCGAMMDGERKEDETN